jgi:D-amino-acid oxidase
MRKGNRAIVVGSGISGLSCALKLQELGIEVEIWTRDRPERTVSMVAAAIWHPYLVFPRERVNRWAIRSYEAFAALTGRPDTGVRFVEGSEYALEPLRRPEWATDAMSMRLHEPDGRTPAHSTFRSLLVETPIYLPWLLGRFIAGGGALVDRTVMHFDEVFDRAPVVINCAGLGAGPLTGDTRLVPVKGQVVRIAPGIIDRFLFDERDPMSPIYMIPRSHDCILGGTAEPGIDNTEAGARAEREIIERCAGFVPGLRHATVLGSIAGARPGRDEVRLEPQLIKDRGLLVHNYGHGGAGVTLSLGCAEEVKSIVAVAIDSARREAIDHG